MNTPFMLALLFFVIGGVLVQAARKSISNGVAETEDSGTLHRNKQPVRFSLFVAVQMIFGFIAILAGVSLAAASLLLKK